MSTVTWNPLWHPQVGDRVGCPGKNLAGFRDVVQVSASLVSYRLSEPIWSKYGVFCRRLSVTKTVKIDSWRCWCRKAKPLVLRGGRQSYKLPVDGVLEVGMTLASNREVHILFRTEADAEIFVREVRRANRITSR
jgi:hypothetical protein